MPFQPIDIGSAINAGDGEAIRNAFAKVNAMLEEVYGFLSPSGFDPDFIAANSLLNGKLATMPANSVKANLLGAPASPDNVSYSALKTALGIAPSVSALAAAYTVIVADIGKVFTASGTWTLGLTAAATLGNGFSFYLKNVGTGVVTIDPNSTEQIDGKATLAIPPKAEALIICDGTGFQTIGLQAEILIGSGTVSAAPTLPIALLAGYDAYRLVLRNFEPVTASSSLTARFATDGVPNFISTASYRSAAPGLTQNNTAFNSANGGTLATGMVVTAAQSAANNWHSFSDIRIYPGSATKPQVFMGIGAFINPTNGLISQTLMNTAEGFAARATHVQLYYSVGNIANGEWELYGLRK